MENINDKKLVELAIKKPDDFRYIIEKYEKKLFWYLKRITNFRDEDLEDLLQEIFIKVYRNLNNYDEKLKFSSWIYRIAHNEAISYFRKNKKRQEDVSVDWEYDEKFLQRVTNDFKINDEIDNNKLGEQIFGILYQMDIKYREVLVYKYFEEKSYDEISDIIKKPVNTVGTYMSRAKKQFNNILEKNNITL